MVSDMDIDFNSEPLNKALTIDPFTFENDAVLSNLNFLWSCWPGQRLDEILGCFNAELSA